MISRQSSGLVIYELILCCLLLLVLFSSFLLIFPWMSNIVTSLHLTFLRMLTSRRGWVSSGLGQEKNTLGRSLSLSCGSRATQIVQGFGWSQGELQRILALAALRGDTPASFYQPPVSVGWGLELALRLGQGEEGERACMHAHNSLPCP